MTEPLEEQVFFQYLVAKVEMVVLEVLALVGRQELGFLRDITEQQEVEV
jgi:hypothetical protein